MSAKESLLIDGNTAIALGAIHCGVRAYYAYPMSPSTTILSYLSQVSHQTGMLVRQCEDEITVAQMALGSMHAGTRALCATSGGGFDLMTETVSLAAIIETPFVCVIAQRPGPATGLPTWTGQGDLNLAIYSGHGEFARIVIACSNPTDCYINTQLAFNLAEKYQVPVIVLTEANIAMSYATVPVFEQNNIPIERGLVETSELPNLVSTDRYAITESGVSKRWLPGTSKAFYYANSDEHTSEGMTTENAEESQAMIDKRMAKQQTILDNLPEAVIYGEPSDAQISFVGFGSTKNTILDALDIFKERGIKANYLHYTYMWPLKTDLAKHFFATNSNIHLVEGNYQGQLGVLLEDKCGVKFNNKFLKYDGRPFYVEEILDLYQVS